MGEGKTAKGHKKLKEGQVSNRVVRYTDSDWELEADLRHAELIVEQLGLTDGKSANTAGVDQTVSCAAGGDEDEPEEDELEPAEATRFRGIAARCIDLQPDRPDIGFAVKNVCRLMSRPTAHAWEMLKRIG